jgi:hypothetical protein
MAIAILSATAVSGCARQDAAPDGEENGAMGDIESRLAVYTEVDLAPDLSALTESQRQVVKTLVEASAIVDDIYWAQAYGDRVALTARVDDPATEQLLQINFGPWDRLRGNEPFLPGVGAKPLGANFYPADATRAEIEAGPDELRSLYTMVRRDAQGELFAVPYHEAFHDETEALASLLESAAALTENESLRNYLELRARALRTDEYQESDFAWMDMTDNTVEIIIGPIETYEDQLLGAKAAHEALVLVKDQEWSARLARYSALLPGLQETLPVDAAYRAEEPGTDGQLNAYDLVFVAGDGNAGSKSIAVNLPNDEQVQLRKGTRRLQIKNAMRAKFDAILMPIAETLIDPEQRELVGFDEFFANTMFHEVAHGLGIKETLSGNGTVREALSDHASWAEEGKADILGLHMITELKATGELPDADLRRNYVTFVASMFRSIRFGMSSAHGRANLVRFNYFREQGAFQRLEDGTYSVDFDALPTAMRALAEKILMLQGDGDRDAVQAFWDEWGVVGPELQEALDRLDSRDIPVDIVYRQGLDVLGL